MSKVLLIYEDYSELNTVQTTLKKVGFDCAGISSEFSTSEQVLSFNPDIVIACGKGPKVSTTGVGRRLKDMHRWNGKTILIFPPGIKPKPQELIKIRMDVVLEAPVQIVRLIQVLANLTNQDDQALMEKLIKTVAHEDTNKENNFISGKKGNSNSSERVYIRGSDPDEKKKDDSQNSSLRGKSRTGQVGSDGESSSGLDNDVTWTHGGQSGDSETAGLWGLDDNEEAKRRGQKSKFDLDPHDPTSGEVRDKSGLGDDQDENSQTEKVDWSEVEKQLFNPAANPGEDAEGLIPKSKSGKGKSKIRPKDAKGTPMFPLEDETTPADDQSSRAPEEAIEPKAIEAMTETEKTSDLKNSTYEMDFQAPPPVESEPATEDIAVITDEAAHGETSGASPAHLSEDEIIQARHAELEDAASHIADKMERYKKMTENLDAKVESSGKRTKVRKAQKELMKDWKKEDLESQDGLRREFTKALFKKN